jgi:hypothetical protein
MKLAAATIMASLVWTGCSVAGPAAPARFEPSESFSLKVGDSAQTADGALRIGFEGVTADSRCPKGVQCMWAGDAVVRLWLQRGAGQKQVRELHTARGATQAAPAPDQDVQLLRLEPYPVAGKTLGPADYVLTLTWGLSPTTGPNR